MDNVRLALVCLLFGITALLLFAIYLNMDKYMPIQQVKAETQQEVYAILENYTCIPKEKPCVYHGFAYSSCEGFGKNATSLLTAAWNLTG